MGPRRTTVAKALARRCLVVGASGQLGSRVADHYERSGWHVDRVVRRSSDESSENFWGELATIDGSYELILNAASPSSSWASKHPTEYLGWMKSHSEKLSELADRIKCACAVTLSTTRIYGSSLQGAISEHYPPNPDGVYAEGHLQSEMYLAESNWTVLRLSNLFGPPGSQGRLSQELVTNYVISGFLSRRETVLRGPSLVRKDFLPASSLIEVLAHVGQSQVRGCLNVVSGKTRTLEDWVHYLASVFEDVTLEKPRYRFESDFPASTDFTFASVYNNLLAPDEGHNFDAEVKLLISYLGKTL